MTLRRASREFFRRTKKLWRRLPHKDKPRIFQNITKTFRWVISYVGFHTHYPILLYIIIGSLWQFFTVLPHLLHNYTWHVWGRKTYHVAPLHLTKKLLNEEHFICRWARFLFVLILLVMKLYSEIQQLPFVYCWFTSICNNPGSSYIRSGGTWNCGVIRPCYHSSS